MESINFVNSFIVDEPHEHHIPANDNDPEFNAARYQFLKDMAYLANCPKDELPAFLKNVPAWDPHAWDNTDNNCYNFALNRSTDDYMYPGSISNLPKTPYKINFKDYKKDILSKIKKDGPRPLKKSFLECASDEMPIALFAGQFDTFLGIVSDGHCFGPRYINTCTGKTKYVWAGKPGEGAPELSASQAGLGYVDIFESAAKKGYTDFCGFMAAPATLQKPPQPAFPMG